jgi:hypothetical protein
MFHIHIMGACENQWLSSYDGNDYSNNFMGEWFGQYKRDTKIYILFINHPVHPV